MKQKNYFCKYGEERMSSKIFLHDQNIQLTTHQSSPSFYCFYSVSLRWNILSCYFIVTPQLFSLFLRSPLPFPEKGDFIFLLLRPSWFGLLLLLFQCRGNCCCYSCYHYCCCCFCIVLITVAVVVTVNVYRCCSYSYYVCSSCFSSYVVVVIVAVIAEL